MAIKRWEDWAEKLPLEERRAYIEIESKKAFELADRTGMYCVMVVWIAGITKPELQKSVALFSNIMDAERQRDYWDNHFSDFVHQTYTFW